MSFYNDDHRIQTKKVLTYTTKTQEYNFNRYVDLRKLIYKTGDLKYSTELGDHDGWLKCDGRELPIVNYPDLYAKIKNKFGEASTGYFKLPDARCHIQGFIGETNDDICCNGDIADNTDTIKKYIRQWTPIGSIIMWNGNTAPFGWGLCNGSTYTRSDGQGTITSPDLRGRFILSLGQGPLGSANNTIGYTGGEENHTLTTNEIPSHNHSINDPGHNHNWTSGAEGDDNGSGGSFSEFTYAPGFNNSVIQSNTTGITVNNTGGDQSHNNMPPYYVLAYIIKI